MLHNKYTISYWGLFVKLNIKDNYLKSLLIISYKQNKS